MRVLIACEFSGIVRDAFADMGHDAWSCDLLATERPTSPVNKHYRCDIRHVVGPEWDLMIAFPPCTHLAVSGARWFRLKRKEQEEAVRFFCWLLSGGTGIPKVAVENPVGIMSTRFRKPDQVVQPWMFGHGETKATCLWLKNLSPLTPTNVVEGRYARVHREPPSPDRWKNRSRTYQGIARAMAQQWGN